MEFLKLRNVFCTISQDWFVSLNTERAKVKMELERHLFRSELQRQPRVKPHPRDLRHSPVHRDVVGPLAVPRSIRHEVRSTESGWLLSLLSSSSGSTAPSNSHRLPVATGRCHHSWEKVWWYCPQKCGTATPFPHSRPRRQCTMLAKTTT